MKLTFQKHVPNFVDCDTPNEEEFENIDQILGSVNNLKYKGFHQFSVSSGSRDNEATLMAEYDEGYRWVVVGYIRVYEGGIYIDLPDWKSKYKNLKCGEEQ